MNSLGKRIDQLKKQKNAVILAHNYQPAEIQDIADYVGDSLELARISQSIQCSTILFCGVHFMAETAKILNPGKKVLLPDLHAGCPMANMITPEQLQAEKMKHPHAAAITYINSTAAVKALSDVCCTSANGVEIVRSTAADAVIFSPDKYLGAYIERLVPEKKYHIWNGYCPTHMVFTHEGVLALKEEHPDALVLVHPECRVEVQAIADRICSTSQMIGFARDQKTEKFIICTETGLLHRLRKINPGKTFIAGSAHAICPNMKLTTLEKAIWALEDGRHEIEVNPEIQTAARSAIEKMVQNY